MHLHRSETSPMWTSFQWTNNKNTLPLVAAILLGQFQLKLFYCGKGRQNFPSNVTLYPCERSRQNHLVEIQTKNQSTKLKPIWLGKIWRMDIEGFFQSNHYFWLSHYLSIVSQVRSGQHCGQDCFGSPPPPPPYPINAERIWHAQLNFDIAKLETTQQWSSTQTLLLHVDVLSPKLTELLRNRVQQITIKTTWQLDQIDHTLRLNLNTKLIAVTS